MNRIVSGRGEKKKTQREEVKIMAGEGSTLDDRAGAEAELSVGGGRAVTVSARDPSVCPRAFRHRTPVSSRSGVCPLPRAR